MKNSAATFQRLVNGLITGIPGCAAYIDDIVLYSNSWNDHLDQLRSFFECVSQAQLTINLLKSEFVKATVVFLGHVVGQGKVCPVEAKVQAILVYPIPQNRRQLLRFLGMVGFYRKFCRNFADVAAPLTNLLGKDVRFQWSKVCTQSFEALKSLLASEPVLAAPRLGDPFVLEVDASEIGVGSVLVQSDHQSINHPIGFFSKKLSKHQRNYSTIEKETLSLVMALQHFDVYLSASPHTTVVYTDHNPLTFISRMKNNNQRLLRWSLFMQEYNLEIRHIKGKDNIVADTLSRA